LRDVARPGLRITPLIEDVGGPSHDGRVSSKHDRQIVGLASERGSSCRAFINCAAVVALSLRRLIAFGQGFRRLGGQALHERSCFACCCGLVVQRGAPTLRDRLLLVKIDLCLVERVASESLPSLGCGEPGLGFSCRAVSGTCGCALGTGQEVPGEIGDRLIALTNPRGQFGAILLKADLLLHELVGRSGGEKGSSREFERPLEVVDRIIRCGFVGNREPVTGKRGVDVTQSETHRRLQFPGRIYLIGSLRLSGCRSLHLLYGDTKALLGVCQSPLLIGSATLVGGKPLDCLFGPQRVCMRVACRLDGVDSATLVGFRTFQSIERVSNTAFLSLEGGETVGSLCSPSRDYFRWVRLQEGHEGSARISGLGLASVCCRSFEVCRIELCLPPITFLRRRALVVKRCRSRQHDH
jgi:hypothetical protein